jgi:GntR family transcriptional regulator
MLFRIDPNSTIPIYEQIVSQVIFGIAAGSLQPGELIPSVRDLGERVTVHPNTVARAYQELERKGVVTARRGKGMEVTTEAPRLCRDERRVILCRRLRDALREAVSSQLPMEDIRRLVDEELARVNGQVR